MALDCTAHNAACSLHKVNSFPTIKIFHALGEPASLTEQGYRFEGAREPKELVAWVEAHLQEPALSKPATSGAPAGAVAAATASSKASDVSHAVALPLTPKAAEAAKAHEPLRPSVMMKHAGERWSEWAGTHKKERIGDATASLLFG